MHWLQKVLLAAHITCLSLWVCRYVCKKRWKKWHPDSKLHIFVISNSAEWEAVELQFIEDAKKHKVLGFDCEWTSTPSQGQQPVALLQLATASGLCILVRLRKMKRPFPESLLTLLSERNILKVGVGPHSDAAKLLKDYEIAVYGYLDLRWMAVAYDGQQFQNLSLQALAQSYLGESIEKSIQIRCSNWDAKILSQKQEKYAAEDAFVAVRIFMHIISSQCNIWSQLSWKGNRTWLEYLPEIDHWVHRPYKPSGKASSNSPKKMSQPSSLVKDHTLFRNSYSVRRSPLYHNCILQAPDAQPLCTCDVKKAQWYLDKGLGDLICKEPFIVRLRFEPSGRPMQDDYYLQVKENCCVVCGAADTYIRKNVIPHEYRRHFPIIMKEHKSHDIVLLCVSCHQISNLFDHELKLQLAKKYFAPLGAAENAKILENPQLKKVRSAARALLQTGIPQERRNELNGILCHFYGVDELDDKVMDKALRLETKTENKDYVSHGLKVVNEMRRTEGLLSLEKLWRQHFLKTMKPKFLPILWSIDHRHDIDNFIEHQSPTLCDSSFC